jgi:hypothetical protein
LVVLADHVGQLAVGLVPLVAPVLGYGGVDGPSVALQGAAGVTELVDPIGERVVRPNTGGDYLGPVAVHLVVQADQVGTPPAFGRLEVLVGVLVLAQALHPPGRLLVALASSRRPPRVALELVVKELAMVSAVAAPPGQVAQLVELAPAVSGGGVHAL